MIDMRKSNFFDHCSLWCWLRSEPVREKCRCVWWWLGGWEESVNSSDVLPEIAGANEARLLVLANLPAFSFLAKRCVVFDVSFAPPPPSSLVVVVFGSPFSPPPSPFTSKVSFVTVVVFSLFSGSSVLSFFNSSWFTFSSKAFNNFAKCISYLLILLPASFSEYNDEMLWLAKGASDAWRTLFWDVIYLFHRLQSLNLTFSIKILKSVVLYIINVSRFL